MTDCAGCDHCPFETTNTIPTDIHEIHITVLTKDTESFINVCNKNKIKLIVINYQASSTDYQEPMTSHIFRGSHIEAIKESERIVGIFEEHNLDPVRLKIETTPTNPIISQCPKGYFELHFAVNTNDREALSILTEDTPLHLSRNAFKENKWMLTLRQYNNDLPSFENRVDIYTRLLKNLGFPPERTITEFCWYDSNLSLDDKWMNK